MTTKQLAPRLSLVPSFCEAIVELVMRNSSHHLVLQYALSLLPALLTVPIVSNNNNNTTRTASANSPTPDSRRYSDLNPKVYDAPVVVNPSPSVVNVSSASKQLWMRATQLLEHPMQEVGIAALGFIDSVLEHLRATSKVELLNVFVAENGFVALNHLLSKRISSSTTSTSSSSLTMKSKVDAVLKFLSAVVDLFGEFERVVEAIRDSGLQVTLRNMSPEYQNDSSVRKPLNRVLDVLH